MFMYYLQLQCNIVAIVLKNLIYNQLSVNEFKLAYNQVMGSGNSRDKISLDFIQVVEDDRLGQVQIYKSEQNTYVMKNVKTFIVNDARFAEFQLQLQTQQTLKDQRAIIPILAYEQNRMKNLCIDYQLCTFYCEYFNFTLEDLIRSAKPVDDSELWLCFKQLLRLSRRISSMGIAAKIELQTTFVTLKGLPAIYTFLTPMRSLKSSEMQNAVQNTFQQDISMIKQVAEIILKLGTMQLNITAGKIESFAKLHPKLSKLIQYILSASLISSAEIYNQIERMENSKEIKIANQIKLNKFRFAIPEQVTKINTKKSFQQKEHDVRKNKAEQNQHQEKSINNNADSSDKNIKQYQTKVQMCNNRQLSSKKSLSRHAFNSQRKNKQQKGVKLTRTYTQTPQTLTQAKNHSVVTPFLTTQDSVKKAILRPKELSQQMLIKKHMHQQSKQKLLKRKKEMQEIACLKLSKNIQGKLNAQNLKQNLSLKGSKMTTNKGFSWSKKVMTSHFDDQALFQRKLKIRN